MILLDTNVVSELFKPRADARVMAWLDSQPGSSLFLCAPVIAELRYGAELLASGRRKDFLQTAIERLETDAYRERILPFDVIAASFYAKFAAQRRKTGRTMQLLDAMIAAVAAANGLMLATRNVSHFDGFPVELINPFEDLLSR